MSELPSDNKIIFTENNIPYPNRRRSERTLKAFTECCDILMNSTSELELLESICRIICKTGGYKMAWVGYAEDNSDKSVRPMAHSGFEDGYLLNVNITWADTERGRGPTGTCIRENKIIVNRDFASNPLLLVWREEALKRGYSSSIAIPLAVNGCSKPLGALTIYSCHTDAFDYNEIELLKTLATFLSHGIISIRRNNARLKLEEENSRLAAVMNATSDFVGIADTEGRIYYYNPAAKRMLGLGSDEDISNIKISDTHPEWVNKIVETEILPALFKEGHWSGETALLDKSGKEVPISHVAMSHRDETGKVDFLAIIARDITERRRNEEQLRKLSTAIEQSSASILITDTHGNIEYINPSFTRISGYSAEEAIGKNTRIFKSGRTPAEVYKQMWDTIMSGQNWQGEFCNRKRNGELYWESASVSPVFDRAGKIINFVAVKEDITERKRMLEELKDSEERFRILIESAPVGRFIIETGKISYANPKFYKILGYDKDEILKSDFHQMLEVEERPNVEFFFRGLVSAEIDWFHVLTKGVRKNGEIIDIELAMLRIQQANSLLFIGSMIDITQRKRAEANLIRSMEEYRSLSARIQSLMEEERERISREIHDELGQALTALKMDVRSIKEVFFGNDKYTDLLKILKRLQDMSNIIDGAIKAGRRIAYDLRPSILDDLGIIEALEWHIQDFQQRTGIKTEFSTKIEHVNMDKDRATAVYRIFQEALTNIAKHSDADMVYVNIRKTAACLRLEIKDNGKGISKRDMRLGSLGILGMKERVMPFGGNIEIKGKKGQGTTVTVTLPARMHV